MSREDFEARVGTWLRRKWKLERLIGVGGMAGVYVARHKIGRVAAIKLLRPEIAVDPQLRERFEQEALAVNSIGHRGVVEILDVDEDEDGNHFLVMELLDGETLADRADREGRMKIATVLDYADQTLDVLVACHRKGVIHRDIKPENLFIQKDGRLKVLDFGIARVREGVQTLAGTMLGTVAFMPPEQLRGTPVDARADLYALGATMFTVLSGRRVHRARDDAELAARVLSEPAPSLASASKDVPEHVVWVVDRALAYLPERRYPDAQTMRGDVWALQRGGRPPYANACREAGMRPDVTHVETERETRPDGLGTPSLPSTDPQMPVFALPTTDPQMPAFAGDPEIELEPTKPETPVLPEEAGDEDEAESPDEERPSAEEAPRSAPAEKAPRSAPADKAPRSASAKPAARTLVGLPRRADPRDEPEKERPATVERSKPLATTSEPPDSEPRASEPPDSLPPARSSKGSAGSTRPASSALAGGGLLGWVVILVVVAVAVAGGSWAAGLWP